MNYCVRIYYYCIDSAASLSIRIAFVVGRDGERFAKKKIRATVAVREKKGRLKKRLRSSILKRRVVHVPSQVNNKHVERARAKNYTGTGNKTNATVFFSFFCYKIRHMCPTILLLLLFRSTASWVNRENVRQMVRISGYSLGDGRGDVTMFTRKRKDRENEKKVQPRRCERCTHTRISSHWYTICRVPAIVLFGRRNRRARRPRYLLKRFYLFISFCARARFCVSGGWRERKFGTRRIHGSSGNDKFWTGQKTTTATERVYKITVRYSLVINYEPR